MESTTNANAKLAEAVNIYREPYDTYVGRAGKNQDGYFGNPVIIGKTCPVCKTIHTHQDGDSSLACFEKYFLNRLTTDPVFYQRVNALKGHKLGCFCKPKAGFQGQIICHAQVMAKWINNSHRQSAQI